MKKKKGFVGIFALLCCCAFIFAGCTTPFSFINNQKNGVYEYTSSSYSENTTIETKDDATESEIAQSYIDISFTVCITRKVVTVEKNEKNETVKTTTSEDLYSYGSGFVVYSGGFILTNEHVVSYALGDPATIKIGNNEITTSYLIYVSQDGGTTKYPAKLLWENSQVDMAIIVCENFANLPSAKLKDRSVLCSSTEKLQLLERVITVGNQKTYYASATTGEITSTLPRVAVSDTNIYEHLIQHNAAINHGNSGGALIDTDGYVVGLNTLGDDDANSLFFAVPIYPAMVILDKVVENYITTKSATKEILLGISAYDSIRSSLINDGTEKFTEKGVKVDTVDSSCIINDLKKGDIIVGVVIETSKGILNFNVDDSDMLVYARMNMIYAQNATFKVKRGGVIVNLTINI